MKKLIFGAIALMAFVSCEKQKIAFVDNSELVNEYQEKKDIEEKFKVQIEAFQKKTDSLSRAFQAEAQEFQDKAAKMARKKAEERYQELGQKQQMLSQQLQYEEQQIQMASQKEIDSLVKKVKNFVKDYGKTNGYTYILGANEAGSVLYGTEANDITSLLLEELNKKYETEKQ
ncbi:OmpH family outer membrane protein [Sungkyunkwania multivorans]|uniref:OmpH family outer membrane protein n=1 Tax=Sungkyunkwania multivorans TaxID=1173618 RepID=A0ABW3D0M0_9FLAO